MTGVISVKKLDNCLRLVNIPTFRLGDIFSPTREHYQRSYQLQCEHYECLNQKYTEEKSFVKEEKLASSPVEKKKTKKQKNIANSSSATAKSQSGYMREYRAGKKTLQNTLLMPSLMTPDGNAIETLLMRAQINTDLVNLPVPSTTKLSTSQLCVETDAYKLINSILRYKDYDSHKNAHKDFQKRFVHNRSIDTGIQFMINYDLEMI
ncbi:uncharacterized protein TNCV_2479881 [Trichonephila clavipes]|nr:uncharacterized protein TNCV_2479881 [Trichonephila clavipes]